MLQEEVITCEAGSITLKSGSTRNMINGYLLAAYGGATLTSYSIGFVLVSLPSQQCSCQHFDWINNSNPIPNCNDIAAATATITR
jgi:hypothetical protein